MKMTETTPLVETNNNNSSSSSSEEEEGNLFKNVSLAEVQDLENLARSRGEVQTPDEELTGHSSSSWCCWFSWRTLWAYAGPGWLMSIAYVDPGNLESDLQAGAYGGYQLIWVLFWSTFMGFFLQVLAARLGVVTGKNLAEMCHLVYPKWASMFLWVMTEIAFVGSDIQEVLGSAIAFQILFGFPLWLGCLVTGLDTFTFLLLHKFGIRKLEFFFVLLIAIMLVCFFVNFGEGGIDIKGVFGGFVPRVESYAATQAVGILGAVIMPHNIFLHSGLVQSRAIDHKNPKKVREANKYFSIEAGGALLISFLINLAVLGVFAKGFFSNDCTPTFEKFGANTACMSSISVLDNLTSSYGTCRLSNGNTGICQAIGLSQAGAALSNMLGPYAETVWAIGLLAAGQSSTMTGTYAGQFVMEGFLRLKISPWKRVALTRCVALIPAITVAIASESHPGKSDQMDELLNVLQSVQLPFALLPVLHFTSEPKIMGKEFANGLHIRMIGWGLGLLVCIINMYLVSVNLAGAKLSPLMWGTLVLLCCLYFGFIGYLIKKEIRHAYKWVRKLIRKYFCC